MHKLTVKQIMSTELVTLEEDENLGLADTIMNLARIRHLPVVRDRKLVGLVTHRDILRAQVSMFADLSPSEDEELKQGVLARDVMTREVEAVSVDTPVLEVARMMYNHKHGCVPVVDSRDNLVGIVTEADFVRLVIDGLSDLEREKDA